MVWTKKTQEVTVTNLQALPWWETTQFEFIRVPKALFRNPYYAGLTQEARMLYALLLDRASLSWASGEKWRTEAGEPFVIFTLAEIGQRLNCSKNTATRVLQSLESHNLITKDRPKKDGPYHIVVNPFLQEDPKLNLGSPQKEECPVPKTEPGQSPKLGRNNTDNNKTEINDTDRITQVREEIHRQIEYVYLLQEFPKEQLDAIVEVMVQVLTSPAKTITVGGIPTDSSLVKAHLRKIPPSQIQYLFEHMEEQTQQIHSYRAYYLARLCDPPGVVDAFYEQEHSIWPCNIM